MVSEEGKIPLALGSKDETHFLNRDYISEEDKD